jgi:hypothetical protein
MDKLDAILFAGNTSLGVSPSSMSSFVKLLETAQPADLGPGPRGGVLSEKHLNESLEATFKGANLPTLSQQLVRALIFLWHDYLDPAHTLVQSIDNSDGAYVHAIMHRREPDYSNAAYWFRRVGRHPAFVELAHRASESLGRTGNGKLQQTLLPKGEWDPFAFVHACEQVANGSLSRGDANCLREVQRVEFEVLLDSIVEVDVR